MAFYLVAHIPPPGCKIRMECTVGGFAAANDRAAERIADERYPRRLGWHLETLETLNVEETETAKGLAETWHNRNDFWRDFCKLLGVRL